MKAGKHTLKIMLSTILLTLLTILSSTTCYASLASQLVPCGNDVRWQQAGNYFEYYNECDVCDLAKLGMNILNFLIVIMVAVAALIFVNAGWLYITSPGNSGNIARAHKLFTSTLMGILIILAAYLLIDTLMRALISGDLSTEANVNGYGPWNEILCKDDTDYYKIKKFDSIDLSASNLELPATTLPTCSEIVTGASCQATCTTSQVTGTSCTTGTVCCLPAGSTTPTELNKVCTNAMATGGKGTCLPWSSCAEGGVLDQAVCGSTYVCCPTTTNAGTPDDKYDCKDYATLKEEFGGAGPVNGPGLDAMISCITSDPTVASLRDSQPPYTHEMTLWAATQNPTCDYTNGRSVCETCSHSTNSCHYGRGTGLGALAADFNAKSSESELFSAIKSAISKKNCGGTAILEGDHTHVSLNSCP